ncbi:RHS repeat domain-containing protein [Actinosynnema sp. CA-248983]
MTTRRVVTRSGSRFVRRSLGVVLTLVLAAGTLSVVPGLSDPARAAAREASKPEDRDPVVAGRAVDPRPGKAEQSPAPPPAATWPTGAAEFDVPAVRAADRKPAAVKAGDLPVWVEAAAGKVRVRALDRAAADRAGATGPLFAVDSAPGKLGVRLAYGGFAEVFGGGFGHRARLVRLPACALSTPDKPDCRVATPVAATNDVRAGTLSAEVEVTGQEGAVLAVAAGTDSAKGDYKATELAASATWQVGTQAGDFTWTYPLRTPPVPGDLAPSLSLTYSSSSVDGRTSSTNNQGSQVGDGFELWPGYIERRYKSCKDDGVPKDDKYHTHPMDQCWAYDNAVLTMGGKGGDLVPAGDGRWKLRKDDGTRIQKFTGTEADTNNGDNNNEYWVMTAPDGTRYHFGRNRLKGWAPGKPETGSTWTVPVFGDDSGEPCHKDSFADSWCQQAWRWNLDYVEDPDGNAVVYHYGQETNRYARNLRAEDDTPYVRGGYLKSAQYGLRTEDLYQATAPARVDFTVSERCLRSASDCAEGNIATRPEWWEDVPWDLNCKPGTKCEQHHGAAAPTFWTRKRITAVTTKVVQADGSGHRTVDSWSFAHDWGTADVDRQLLLKSIVHTGHAAATPFTMPPVLFGYTQRPNRVDKLGDDVGPFVKNRVGSIQNETGGQLDVNYSAPDCTPGTLPAPHTNDRRCYPTYWAKSSGDTNPTLDWFHKYVVTQTVQTDLTGGSPDMVTDYDYTIGKPGWRYADDDGLTPEKYKTWSQWHGYDKVRVRAGVTGSAPTQTDHWFFRGMHGDRLNGDGGTKDVKVTDGEGASHTDHESLQGMAVRTVTYDKAGGTPVLKVVQAPWRHQTASRTRPWGTVTADLTGVAATRTLTLVDGGWREEKSTTPSFHLTTGAPAQVDDQGDVAVAGDEKCTTTTFTDNGERVLAKPAQVRVVARRCADTPDLSKDLVSDDRTFYDGGAFKAAPSRGDVTLLEKVKDATATAVTYLPASRTKYDRYGRKETLTNAAGAVTTMAYTETHGVTTRTSVTTPPAKTGDAASAHTTSKDLDPAWGHAVRETDAGGKTTTLAYDALGHLAKVWTPGRSTSALPDKEFQYHIKSGAVVAVAGHTLTPSGARTTSFALFDGWLRQRQVQAPGRDGATKGRLVSDTFYNAAGQVDRTYEPYYADGEPRAVLFGVANPGQIETQHVFEYDGQGRKTVDRLLVGSSDVQEKWRTRYEYGGNWTKVVPPAGGTPVTTFVDAHDRKTEVREHRASGHVSTTFTYDHRGQEARVTAPGGHTWTAAYDVRGRKVQSTDPDKGTVKITYDDLDRITSTTDARGRKLAFAYDGIGRKTAQYDATTASPGTKLAEWTYDTVRKGQLTGSTRFVGTAAYTIQVDFYDNLDRPTRKRVVLPDTEGALGPAGGWVFDTSYNPDGSVKATGSPAAGNLPAETISNTYDELGRLIAMGSNLSTYLVGVDHSKTGKVLGQRLSTGGTGKQVDQIFAYEHGTQRLKKATTAHAGMAGVDRSVEYDYSDAGNVRRITDTSRDGVDNQCFRYDDLRRLVDAWTEPTATCSADPAEATIGGIAPYRVNYSYDDSGNRTGQTDYGPGPAGGATTGTRGYRYAGGEGVDAAFKGHQLATVTGTNPESYTYDATGNTTQRKTSTSTQTLTWDTEGELVKVVDDKKGETSFVHTADGDRLLRRDPTGTTLYLPDLEVRLAKGATTATATRHYQNAVRTAAGVVFLVGDHHGSTEVAINAADGTVSRRRFTPFGEVRTSRGTWPSGYEKGFVGGTVDDAAGFTTLGARSYVPGTGRFLSVDPVIGDEDTQQRNGYNYANNNPTTMSDADGLYPRITAAYPIAYRYFWVRSGSYTYLLRQTLYLVHVQVNLFFGYWTFAVATSVVARQRVVYGPFLPGREPPGQRPGVPEVTPRPQAPAQQATQPEQPKRKCSFLSKCLWQDFGDWWGQNKNWVKGGAAVGAMGTCFFTAGLGCTVAGYLAAGVSIADRGKDLHKSGYSLKGSLKFATGTAYDIYGLKFIPPARLAGNAKSVRVPLPRPANAAYLGSNSKTAPLWLDPNGGLRGMADRAILWGGYTAIGNMPSPVWDAAGHKGLWGINY